MRSLHSNNNSPNMLATPEHLGLGQDIDYDLTGRRVKLSKDRGTLSRFAIILVNITIEISQSPAAAATRLLIVSDGFSI